MSNRNFRLNEARIDRRHIDQTQILKSHGFSLSQRHALLLQRELIERFGLPCIARSSSINLVSQEKIAPKDLEDFLKEKEIEGASYSVTTFGRLAPKLKRQILGSMLEIERIQEGIFREGFLRFYDYQEGEVSHKTLAVMFLQEEAQYRLFLEPGSIALYEMILIYLHTYCRSDHIGCWSDLRSLGKVEDSLGF